jgi:hypothetical protein
VFSKLKLLSISFPKVFPKSFHLKNTKCSFHYPQNITFLLSTSLNHPQTSTSIITSSSCYPSALSIMPHRSAKFMFQNV